MSYPNQSAIESARTTNSPERLRMLAGLHEREVNDALYANPMLPLDVRMDLPTPSAWDDAERW